MTTQNNAAKAAQNAVEWATNPGAVENFPATARAHINGLASLLLSKLRAPVADERKEIAGVTLDGYLETLFRVGEHLGIDYAASRKQPGAPSSVYIKAIADRISQAGNAAREEAAKLMDQTSRSGGATLIRALASATVAGEAQPADLNTRLFEAAIRDLAAISEHLSLDPDEGGAEPIIEAIDELRRERNEWVDAGYAAAASAAPQAGVEPLTRYCPGCGRIGPVEGEYRDCCPDGNEARMIPVALAEKCRDTFRIAVKVLLTDAAANDSGAPQASAEDVELPGIDADRLRAIAASGSQTAMSNALLNVVCALKYTPAPTAAEGDALLPAPTTADRKAWEADMHAAGARHLGGNCWEWDVDDFEYRLWQLASHRRQRTEDAPREDDMLTIAYLAGAQAEKERAGDALLAELLDDPLLRDLLGYIEDTGPADVWRAAQAWMAKRNAALALHRWLAREIEKEDQEEM